MGHFIEKYHIQILTVTDEEILTYPYVTLWKKKASKRTYLMARLCVLSILAISSTD